MKHNQIFKYGLVLAFLLFYVSSFSQEKKAQNDPGYEYKAIHFGFTVGGNFMDFGFDRVLYNDPSNSSLDALFPDVTTYVPGFHVGIISDVRLNDYFSIRILPTVTFGSRKLTYYNRFNNISNYIESNPTIADQWDIESTYIEFPILLKIKSQRLNNYMPYFIAGFNAKFDMAAELGTNTAGDNPPKIVLKPFDFCYELGFGIDWFLPYFKLGTEFKISIGMRDLMLPNPFFIIETEGDDPYIITRAYTNSVSKLTSNIFMISFHFE